MLRFVEQTFHPKRYAAMVPAPVLYLGLGVFFAAMFTIGHFWPDTPFVALALMALAIGAVATWLLNRAWPRKPVAQSESHSDKGQGN